MRMRLALLAVVASASVTVSQAPATRATTAQPTGSFDLYIVNTGGTDATANDGQSLATGIRTLERAHEILESLQPDQPVNIYIQAGTYHCRGMRDQEWDFFNGHRITITSLSAVPAPASTSRDHTARPVFVGQEADGSSCADGSAYFMNVMHPKVETNLTVSNLRFERYKGAIQIIGINGYTSVQQGNVIENNVFWRLGDLYLDDNTGGRAAIGLEFTNGTEIRENYFWHIRNQPQTAALIHAIYFYERASWTSIEDNLIGGVSGVAVKISHFSNFNTFSDNSFMYAPAGIIDRFCGSRENPDVDGCNDGVTQCPSWGTVVEASNSFTNMDLWDVGVYGFDPTSQPSECTLTPPPNNIRVECLHLHPDVILTGAVTGNCPKS